MKRRRPYWIDDGETACEICGGAITIQTELRCAGCDAGVCEHCVVTVRETREVMCVPCDARGEND